MFKLNSYLKKDFVDTIDFNDIPVGDVFYARVDCEKSDFFAGIFIKNTLKSLIYLDDPAVDITSMKKYQIKVFPIIEEITNYTPVKLEINVSPLEDKEEDEEEYLDNERFVIVFNRKKKLIQTMKLIDVCSGTFYGRMKDDSGKERTGLFFVSSHGVFCFDGYYNDENKVKHGEWIFTWKEEKVVEIYEFVNMTITVHRRE